MPGTHINVLQELIGPYTDVEHSNAEANSSLEELGLDSIAAVQLAKELLLRLQLQIHPDELFKISSSTLTEYVQKSPPALAEPPVTTPDKVNISSASLSTPPPTSNPTTVSSSIAQGTLKARRIPVERVSETPSIAATEIQQLPPESLPPSLPFDPLQVLAQSDSIYEAVSQRSGFAGYWDNVSPLQNDLLLAYINEAFITLGVNLSEQPQGVEIPAIPCIPKYNRLMKRLLDILETRYIVRQNGGKVLRGSDPIGVDTSSRLCEQFRTQHPAFECEAKLMNLIGPRLAECLSGKLDPLSVLFGSAASRQIMDDFYRSAPIIAAHAEQLVLFLVNLVQWMAAISSTSVRILEVGGGTGGTTTPLIAALEGAKVPVKYTFTDVGASFVNKAKAKWGRNQWMEFSVLDIEEELTECFHGQYDIVLGVNVVHATRDRTATSRRLREALRPGGVLVLSELTRPIDWYDICFGLLDGWWLADGGKGYAIQPASIWMDAFETAGFKGTGHSHGNSEEANTQQILVACTC
ncbi:S-adenosyl-L-methionine-dependent methyltransferase [Nemania abortiva]|nr:S-adenosyl-L-methionine-dependent methyltransferase [Nemania abortiva]